MENSRILFSVLAIFGPEVDDIPMQINAMLGRGVD